VTDWSRFLPLSNRPRGDDGEVTRLNRVFDQSPSPGELVPRGTTVILRII